MTNFKGARVSPPEELGVLAVSDKINHLVGTTATLLNNRKAVKKGQTLVLHCEVGNFRYRSGQFDGNNDPAGNATVAMVYSAYAPTTKTDGTGAGLLSAGDRIAIAAGEELTFVGDVSGAILTYWYQ